jgi:amino acid transporter
MDFPDSSGPIRAHTQFSAKINHPAGSNAGAHPQPKRALGFRDLVMFYVVATLSLRWIAVAAAAGPGTVVIWLIGLATIFLPLALCVMELSSRYPQEGGMYIWSKRAFGDFAGFLTGWIYWTSNLPYFPAVLYFAASNALYVGGNKWKGLQTSATFFIVFSLAGLGLALALNLVGLDVGKWLSNLGAIGTWLPVGLLCVIGAVAWKKFGSATSFASASLTPSLHWATIGVWSTVLYAFSGAESASFMGGEIKNVRRTIPRALLVAGVLITAGYILGTVAILVVLPHGQLNSLEGIMQAISSSAERVGWRGLGPAVALLICVSNLGGVGAYLAALSRIPFVAGIDRYLPPAFGRVHPRWGTPHISLIVQALCCVLFIVLGQLGSTVHGAYQVLVSMTIITNFIPYLFMFAALIRLQREPIEPGVMRVPGGKPVAIMLASLGFATTCAVIIGSTIPDPSEPNKWLAVGKIVALSAALLGGGLALYAAGKRRSLRAD